MSIAVYPDNRAYFKFSQDPVQKDFAVYLSEPSMKTTFEVIGRASGRNKVDTVISSYTTKHKCADGTPPAVVHHG